MVPTEPNHSRTWHRLSAVRRVRIRRSTGRTKPECYGLAVVMTVHLQPQSDTCGRETTAR